MRSDGIELVASSNLTGKSFRFRFFFFLESMSSYLKLVKKTRTLINSKMIIDV